VLEPYAAKVACTVLEGLGVGNDLRLLNRTSVYNTFVHRYAALFFASELVLASWLISPPAGEDQERKFSICENIQLQASSLQRE
jgi:hypothetical protein